MDIEEAKDILLNVVADEVVGAYCIEIQKETDCAKNCENDDCFIIRAIETVLKELELKDKVINEMSKSFVTHMIGIAQEYSVDANFLEKEKLIEYFTNKVKLQSNKQSQ